MMVITCFPLWRGRFASWLVRMRHGVENLTGTSDSMRRLFSSVETVSVRFHKLPTMWKAFPRTRGRGSSERV